MTRECYKKELRRHKRVTNTLARRYNTSKTILGTRTSHQKYSIESDDIDCRKSISFQAFSRYDNWLLKANNIRKGPILLFFGTEAIYIYATISIQMTIGA